MLKLKNIETYIITFFILLSFNVNPNTLTLINMSFADMLNFFRFFFPGILIFFLFIKKKKLQTYNINYLIIIYFCIIFINSLHDFWHPNNLYFFMYLMVITYSILLINYYDQETNFLNISFAILVYSIFVFALIFHEVFSHDQPLEKIIYSLRTATIFHKNDNWLLNNSSLRSTGASRALLMLNILTFCLIIYANKKKLFNLSLNLLFIINFLLILSLESRFSIISLIIVFLYLLFLSKLKYSILFRHLIILLIFPIVIFTYSSSSVEKLRIVETSKNFQIISENLSGKNLNKTNPLDINNTEIKIKEKTDEISTGRLSLWKKLFFLSKEKKFLYGHGILSELKNFNISASNALIYSLYSGGIFAVIFFLIITFKTIIIIFNLKLATNTKNTFLKSILIVILLRCVVENSFTSYGYDLLIFLITFNLLKLQTKSY